MTRTPDKNEVSQFLENSKLGKLKYERSPTITSYRQVLPCLRVKPSSKGNTPDNRNNCSFGLGRVNGSSNVSINNSIQSDKSSLQLDSSSLDISLINGDSFINESIKSTSISKSKKDIEKLTEDSLKRIYDKETKKSAYMNALKSFEESIDKSLEKLDNSLNEAIPPKDSWENKREQKIEELIKTFKNIKIPLPESKIEIPKPVKVVEVNFPKPVPSLSQPIVPESVPQTPATFPEVSSTVLQVAPTIPQTVPNVTAPIQKKESEVADVSTGIQKTVPVILQGNSLLNNNNNNNNNNTTIKSQSFQPENKNQVLTAFEASKGISLQGVQASNLFSSEQEKENVAALPANDVSSTLKSGSVEFSFASAFSNDFEDTSVPTAPVINIKSLSLQDYANVPSEAIYDYYIYHRYVLFNKAKQFEETNSEKAKSIKRCFSGFNKLTETNQRDVLSYLLNVYHTRQCQDGNKTIQLLDEDSSFEFAVFRGCFVALNFMVSQKFTLILYNLAAVVSVLCSKIPLYRDCFLGFLYKQCPYAIPYIPSKKQNETQENYNKRCGNLRNMSSVDFQLFIQKNMKFYGAILQMNLPEEKHPLNMFYAWNYVQRFLTSIELFQKNKLPISSCIIIEGFLSTCSHRLFELYNRRFTEVFQLIKNFYLPNIIKIEDQANDLNQQAYHLLLNFINRVDKVITKQNRSQELKDFDIPDRFFIEFCSNSSY